MKKAIESSGEQLVLIDYDHVPKMKDGKHQWKDEKNSFLFVENKVRCIEIFTKNDVTGSFTKASIPVNLLYQITKAIEDIKSETLEPEYWDFT